MKHVCLILATFAACIAMMHAATNDYIWSQKPASGPLVSRNLTPVVGRLVGFPSSINAPDTIIIGSGLTLTGSTLSASGSGSVATDSIFDAAGDLVQGTGANTSARVALGTSGQLLRVKSDLSGVEWATVSGTGTVTSVAMSVPSILSVAGSPVTTSGTLAVTLATQAANRIFAGPATGADATPAFRALVADDIPSLSGVYQPLDADLTTYAGITPSANVQTLLGSADYAAFKTSLSLGSVENTALSTWAGTTNITTLGTITTGTWTGTAIGTGYLASGATLDTEWDTAAEINAATTDADFLTTTAAASAYQPLDADLTTLSSATAAGLALMDDADASAQRTTLGLASAALLGANQIFTDTNIFAVGPTEELVVLAEAQGLRLRDNAVDTNTINLIEVQDEDGNQTLVVDSGGALTAVGGITAASFSGTGSALTGLNASSIASGTVGTARLGTGTANSTTFLRGDGTWATPAGSGTVTATSGTLTASAIMVGNGTTDIKALASLGTTTTVLHGNAAGLPTFGAVSLTADVSGTLPVANGGTGATALTDLITLATHTTGNYVATIADSGASEVTVANSGSENAAVTLALAAGITRDTEWDTLAEVETAMGSINILAATEIDTSAELTAILGDESGTGNILTTNGAGGSLTGIPTSIAGTANQITASASTGAVTLSLPATITGLTSVTSTGFTGALTGNASTATTLATARTINGVSFDGSANVADYATDSAGSDTYAITLSPAPGAYITNAHYRFIAGTANTGACTININSLGAKTIKKAAGGITTDLADNDIRSGQAVDLVYDGTNMQMQSTLGNAAAGGSGGNWVLVSTTTISGSPSTIDFDVSTGYRKYRIELDSVISNGNGYILQLRTSTDGGSTYDSGASDYNYGYGPSGTYAPVQGTAGEIALGPAIGSDAGEGWSGEIDIYNPSATSNRPTCKWSLFGAAYNAVNYNIFTGGGRRNTAADYDHVRLLIASSQTFASGTIYFFRWSE